MTKMGIYAILTGGILEITLAVLHFSWPFQFIAYGQFKNLSDEYRDLVLLMSLAIGVCLLVFGLLSVCFSYMVTQSESLVRIFCISQELLWMGRAILEFLYPVNIPLLGIQSPTVLVMPGVFILVLLYAVPVVSLSKNKK